MNKWNIPEKLEQEIRKRDKVCVYCCVEFGEEKKTKASWEHIINDASIITSENLALCCVACNASKGAKRLSDWINSKYCQNKGINPNFVAPVIKEALKKNL